MTLVLIGKDLVLEGLKAKNRGHSQVPGIYIYILTRNINHSWIGKNSFSIRPIRMIIIFDAGCQGFPRDRPLSGEPVAAKGESYNGVLTLLGCPAGT